ncbi:MAG: hypothetical protein R3249_11265 [Nitriliruptorales bacterium]|nr:hypothetical protein [Nitriliruptorales bacterium]
MRRLTQLIGLVALLLLGTAGVAVAAYAGSMTKPASGSQTIVTADVPTELRIERHCHGLLCGNPDPQLNTGDVWFELRRGTNPAIGSKVNATCVSNCSDTGTSTWTGPTVKPTGSPWPVTCNGQYQLRSFVKGNYFDGALLNFVQPPAPVAGLAANGEVGDVTVSWNATPTADVFGILVARKGATDANFVTLTPTPLARTATSYHDATVTAEQLPVTYRLAMLRHDGRVGGQWVDACTDTATTLEDTFDPCEGCAQTLSVADVKASVVSPSPSPNPSETGTEEPTGDPSGEPTEEPSEPKPAPTPTSPTTVEPADPDDDDGPPARPNISVPERPAPQTRYYGDDLGFSEELDFGAIEEVTDGEQVLPDDPFDDDSEFALDVEVPTTTTILDEEAVVKPVAIGLLLLTLGMHIRRWMLEG